jgi:GT2 family glycosyltransferase
MHITAIAASHNRRDLTLACLASYFDQDIGPSITLAAVLVDDGSTDGTAEAVRRRFPKTTVITGSGDLFWARGMALAEENALVSDPDSLLWLNDDVVLDKDALSRLIDTSGSDTEGCIAVGAVRDPVTGDLTYSGVRRRGFHPLVWDLVAPADNPVEVETFNGNIVLVPRPVTARVGVIDGALWHSAADFDYGLRAAHAGVHVLLAPSTVGTCARDGRRRPWLDPRLNRREGFRVLFSLKGLPPRPRARYLMRHGGMTWPVFWVWPYLKAIMMITYGRHRAKVVR